MEDMVCERMNQAMIGEDRAANGKSLKPPNVPHYILFCILVVGQRRGVTPTAGARMRGSAFLSAKGYSMPYGGNMQRRYVGRVSLIV